MKVSVCGCGWLGLPLAKHLVQKGYNVYGSKRDPDSAERLKEDGIAGVALELPFRKGEKDGASPRYSDFFNTDTLIINIPPGPETQRDDHFVKNIQSLSMAAKKHGCRRVVFISTTSVYGNAEGEVDEFTMAMPNTDSGHAYLLLEQWLREHWGSELVVLRLAGLIGPGRHPVRYLAGRKGVANGNQPVNLIHLDDCIQAIEQIIACWPSQNVLHLSAPSHPSREAYYTAMAAVAELPVPEFTSSSDCRGKTINAQHTCELLGMDFRHPDLMKVRPELP